MRGRLINRILVVGGELAVRDELCRVLLRAGISPSAAPASADGSRREEPPDAPTPRKLNIETAPTRNDAFARFRAAIAENRPYSLVVVFEDSEPRKELAPWTGRLLQDDPALYVVLLANSDAHWKPKGIHDRLFVLDRSVGTAQAAQWIELHLAREEWKALSRRRAEEFRSLQASLERAQERAEVAERTKSEFIANIGHEIRTPMNAILGFSRMLLSETLEPDQENKLQYICDAGESLSHIIDDVLDYSKLGTGKLMLRSVVFDVDSVIQDVQRAVRTAAEEKGLSLHFHTEQAVPRKLLGDGVRFRQVLGNLVDNAIKFTQQGAINVQTALDEQTEDSTTLRVVVADTGIGIAADRQAVVLDEFSQADGSSTRRFGGTGLGLAVCKQLVDLIGGQIGFRSVEGQGTTFWFTVTFKNGPCADSDPAGEPSIRRTTLPTHCGPTKHVLLPNVPPRVLVADDDHLNRTMLELLLTRAGCVVDLAGNGRETLDMLRVGKYDLALLDVEMPEIDGIEVIRRLRGGAAGTGSGIPIVAISASVPDDCRERCLAAGADDFLPKPFTPEVVVAVVKRRLPVLFEPAGAGGVACPADTGSMHETRRTTVDCFDDLKLAFDEQDFHRIEQHAQRLKDVAERDGAEAVADHAMRIQLAARSVDRRRIVATMDRLKDALDQKTNHNAAAALPPHP